MKNNIVLSLLILNALFTSCSEKDSVAAIECDILSNALVILDDQSVETELNKFLPNMNSEVNDNDPTGHKKNFEILVDAINDKCLSIEVELSCYACVYTFPAQSELTFMVDSLGVKVSRIVDIRTPDNGVLEYLGMHEVK